MDQLNRQSVLPSRFAFTTDELPAQLDDRARFSLWRERYLATFGRLDLCRADDRPFSVRFQFSHFGSVGLGQLAGTISRLVRTSRHIAADANQDICLALNRGRSLMLSLHRGRENRLAPGAATLFSDCDVADMWGGPENAVLFLQVPRRELIELVAGVEDLAGTPIDRTRPAMRYLRRYLDVLLKFDGIGDDPAVRTHIGTTLFDLVVLALGATRESAEVARMRGLRAARLQAILTEINAGFADPAFSVRDVAARLGLTPRYVQDVLHETGTSFSERVLELRMQSARSMLAHHSHQGKRVSDIAYASGFNDISYFNRCFRRRFGAPPTQYRGELRHQRT